MRTWILIAFAAAACGGKVTSVDGNQNTSTLTPVDQNQLCDDTYNYAKSSFSNGDIAKLQCGFSTESSSDPATCAQTYQTCLGAAESNPQFQWPATPDCTSFNEQITKCNTTVAEYTKCFQQEIDAVKSMESSLPLCSQADAEKLSATLFSKMSTDCIQLMQSCQVSFASGSSGSSGGGVPDAGPPDGG